MHFKKKTFVLGKKTCVLSIIHIREKIEIILKADVELKYSILVNKYQLGNNYIFFPCVFSRPKILNCKLCSIKLTVIIFI